MADLIATEAYAKNIGGKNISYTSNLGCTKSRAIALGCNVKGTYTDKQLVCQKDLSKPSTIKYSLRNLTDTYLSNIRVEAGSCVFTGNLPSSGKLYSTRAPSGSSWSILVNGSMPTTQEVYPAPNSDIHEYEYREK